MKLIFIAFIFNISSYAQSNLDFIVLKHYNLNQNNYEILISNNHISVSINNEKSKLFPITKKEFNMLQRAVLKISIKDILSNSEWISLSEQTTEISFKSFNSGIVKFNVKGLNKNNINYKKFLYACQLILKYSKIEISSLN